MQARCCRRGAAPAADGLYRVLGLPAGAAAEDVRRAYLRRAGAGPYRHPDRGGCAEDFRKLQNAYSVLADPTRRRYYDQVRSSPLGHLPIDHVAMHLDLCVLVRGACSGACAALLLAAAFCVLLTVKVDYGVSWAWSSVIFMPVWIIATASLAVTAGAAVRSCAPLCTACAAERRRAEDGVTYSKEEWPWKDGNGEQWGEAAPVTFDCSAVTLFVENVLIVVWAISLCSGIQGWSPRHGWLGVFAPLLLFHLIHIASVFRSLSRVEYDGLRAECPDVPEAQLAFLELECYSSYLRARLLALPLWLTPCSLLTALKLDATLGVSWWAVCSPLFVRIVLGSVSLCRRAPHIDYGVDYGADEEDSQSARAKRVICYRCLFMVLAAIISTSVALPVAKAEGSQFSLGMAFLPEWILLGCLLCCVPLACVQMLAELEQGMSRQRTVDDACSYGTAVSRFP